MIAMLGVIEKIVGMMSLALSYVSRRRSELLEKHAVYLDKVSEVLASAALAVQERKDFTAQLSELRFHLDNIKDVLRLGDPTYLMGATDPAVERLSDELGKAIEATSFQRLCYREYPSPEWEEWVDEMSRLEQQLLEASGLFRAAAITVRAQV